jgi:hypothetical protein
MGREPAGRGLRPFIRQVEVITKLHAARMKTNSLANIPSHVWLLLSAFTAAAQIPVTTTPVTNRFDMPPDRLLRNCHEFAVPLKL